MSGETVVGVMLKYMCMYFDSIMCIQVRFSLFFFSFFQLPKDGVPCECFCFVQPSSELVNCKS